MVGMSGISGMFRISGMLGQTSSVIPFWNDKNLQFFHGSRLGMPVMVGIVGIAECQEY